MKTIIYTLALLSSTLLYKDAIASSEGFYTHPEELIFYNPTHPNAENIKRCLLINTNEDSCKFSEAPLIGLHKEKITIQDILDKTVASKKAYLETFKSVLQKMPPETLMLFGAVNAIAISERIVPSFYSFQSGAIYLNAAYFWTTAEEKAVATANKDFRDSFGSQLSFSEETNYYNKKGESLYKSNKQTSRTVEELTPIVLSVLFHELTHANDFFPKSFYNSFGIDTSKTINETAMSRLNVGLMLSQKIRLNSTLCEDFAAIFNFGEEPSEIELNMDPKYLIEPFLEDAASDLYAYTNTREDLAMLVENNLVYYYLHYSPTTIFIKYPTTNFKIPKDYKKPVLGGVKNKIAAPNVKERALPVLTSIFDEVMAKKIIDNLDKVQPKIIPENMSWKKIESL